MGAFITSIALISLSQASDGIGVREFLDSGLFLTSQQFREQNRDLTLTGKRETFTYPAGHTLKVTENILVRLSASGLGRVDAETTSSQGERSLIYAGLSMPGQTYRLASGNGGRDWTITGDDPMIQRLPKPEQDPTYRLSSHGLMGTNSHIGAVNLIGQYLTASNIKYRQSGQDTWRGLAVKRLEGEATIGTKLMQKIAIYLHTSPTRSVVGIRFEHVSGRGSAQDKYDEYMFDFPKGEIAANGLPHKISFYRGPAPSKLALLESIEYSNISRERIDPAVFELSAFSLTDPDRPSSGWSLLAWLFLIAAAFGGLAFAFLRAARKRKERSAIQSRSG